jgi:hypothetical protein
MPTRCILYSWDVVAANAVSPSHYVPVPKALPAVPAAPHTYATLINAMFLSLQPLLIRLVRSAAHLAEPNRRAHLGRPLVHLTTDLSARFRNRLGLVSRCFECVRAATQRARSGDEYRGNQHADLRRSALARTGALLSECLVHKDFVVTVAIVAIVLSKPGPPATQAALPRLTDGVQDV